VTGHQPPTFKNGKRTVIIAHREFLGNITGSTSFAIQSYNLNPGDAATFPWLSGLAVNFDQWSMLGCLFEFVSTSADALNSTNTALGQVILATQYNINRPEFASKVEMENCEYSTSSRPSQSFLHPIECAPAEKTMQLQYVRVDDITGTDDPRFYDLGRFSIATVGMQAAAVIGELWVTYEIELFKPIMPPGGYGGALWAHQRITSYTNTNILGPIIAENDGNMRLTVSANGAGYDRIHFPVTLSSGTFMLNVSWYGTSTAALAVSTALANAAVQYVYANDAAAFVGNEGYTGPNFVQNRVFRITGPGAYITFSGATLPTSGTYGDLFLMQIGEGVTYDEEKEDVVIVEPVGHKGTMRRR
jgi:hypothetical protein